MDDKLEIVLEEWFEAQEKKRVEVLAKFPSEPPNDVCNYAFIKGISCSR